MQKKSGDFSVERAKELAQTPAGKQLLSILQGNEQLQRAAQQAAAGDLTQARQALEPLLNSPQIQALLKQLGEQNG